MTPLQATQKIINQALRFLDNRLTKLGDRVEKAQKAPVKIDTSTIERRMNEQNDILARVMGHIQKSANRAVEVKGSIKADNSDVIKAVNSSGDKAVTSAKKTQEAIDRGTKVGSNVATGVGDMVTLQMSMTKMMTALCEKVDMIAQALKKLDSLKIDEQQFRQLAARSGGSTTVLGGGGGGERVGSKAKVSRVALTATNTEYSHTFSKGCVGYTIKLDEQNAKLYFAWESGKMPAGGDSSAYMTAPQNYLHSPPKLEPSGKTIYLGSNNASVTAEIEEIIG